MTSGREARVAIVGDFNPRNRTHVATSDALEHLGLRFDWVATDRMGPDPHARLAEYAGIFIAPASPYRDMDGALGALRDARERGVPLVAT
jgi:CTP synthase (UTP-ammonia lyase)